MRRSNAPSILQHGDPKKSRHGPKTRGGDAAAEAAAAEAAAAASAHPPLAPAAAAAQATIAAKKPYKCPLPGAQTGGGTLGLRRAYGAAAGDLLKALTRLVVIDADDGGAAAAEAAAAAPLVLYDPSLYDARVAPDPAIAAAAADNGGGGGVKQEEEGAQADRVSASGSSSGDCSSGDDDDDGGDSPGAKKENKMTTARPSTAADSISPPSATGAAPSPRGDNGGHPLLGRRPIFADPFLARKLRPHQREGVRFVFECLTQLREAGRAGCVLADGMGLGKTFQACCTIWFLLQNNVFFGPGVPTCARPIILCPTSLVRNWGNELDQWLEGRVEAVVVDDSRAPAVKAALAAFAGPTGRTTAGAMLRAKLAAGLAERQAAADAAAAEAADAAAMAEAAAAAAAGGEGGAAAAAAGAGAIVRRGPPPPPPPPARMPGKPKVMVMSYTTFRMYFNQVSRLQPDLIVCDEAHHLKNSEARTSAAVAALGARAAPRLLLSGTPVQNDLSEFYSVFSLALPGLLGDPRAFSRVYERPILRGRDADADEADVGRGLEAMGRLGALCHRFMLRRTSAVLKRLLPPRVEQVVFCRPSRLQLALFQAFLEAPAVQALVGGRAGAAGGGGAGGRGGVVVEEEEDVGADAGAGAGDDGVAGRANAGKGGGAKKKKGASPATGGGGGGGPKPQRLAPLVAIGMLKKLCCHPSLIYDCIAGGGGEGGGGAGGGAAAAPGRRSGRSGAAPVSYAEPSGRGGGGGADDPPPGPQLTGFEGALPLFSAPSVWPPFRPGERQPQHSGKLMVLDALLKAVRSSAPTDKVVLVSNHTTNLDVMGALCASRGWRTLRLDGSSSAKARQGTVDRFNAEGAEASFALLLSSKAGGTGLNIIGANRLVLMDSDWNPGNDLQAMARVWREGQKKTCQIYRLLLAGSIEEKIYQRQLSKCGLADTLVDKEEERRTFSRAELRSLFAVAPEAVCETHAAVKCACDGSAAAAAAKRARAEALVAAAEGGGGGGKKEGGGPSSSPDAAGVGAWAHYASARDNEADPVWRAAPAGVVDAYVSFLFSDHAVNDAWWRHERAEQRRARQAAGGSGGSGSEDVEDEEDDEAGAAAAAAAAAEAPAPRQPKARRKTGSGSGDDDDDDEEYDGACAPDDDEW